MNDDVIEQVGEPDNVRFDSSKSELFIFEEEDMTPGVDLGPRYRQWLKDLHCKNKPEPPAPETK